MCCNYYINFDIGKSNFVKDARIQVQDVQRRSGRFFKGL